MPDIDLFLWSRVKTGDKEAFQILFDKYYALLCLLSRRYTSDIEKSREITQNLFMYLWEHRYEITVNTSLKSYLCQAVRFNSIRYIENDRKAGIRIEDFPESVNYQELFDHIEYAELQDKIIRSIDSLPEQCQKVFKLSRFEQLKYTEIAERLDISLKTVESHISKALRVLEEKLKGY